MSKSNDSSKAITSKFCELTGLTRINHSVLDRVDGDFLVLKLWNPTERHFQILSEVLATLEPDDPYKDRVTIKKEVPLDPLNSSEVQLLLKNISENLTVSDQTYGKDFDLHYIRSIFNAEDQILTRGNHVVFGRRGSGKSSLLLYAKRKFEREGKICIWVGMQKFDKLNDDFVALEIFRDIIEQISSILPTSTSSELLDKIDITFKLVESGTAQEIAVRKVATQMHRSLKNISSSKTIAIFLDDFHVLDRAYQPLLLSHIYAIARGNNIDIKVSAIEKFTKIWDPIARVGLEMPNDAQAIKLDYNLTMPDKAKEHIEKILLAHANHCGIPSIGILCGDGLIERLTWVSAGVPRDALNIFMSALRLSSLKNQKRISLSAVNLSAAESLADKRRYISIDARGNESILTVLEAIKKFCITISKKNAFLVEKLDNNPSYEAIINLVDLRFLHVISSSITPGEASKAYVALILDYGFYVGVRAAQRMELFNKDTITAPSYRALRGLPRFPINQ